MKEWACGVSGKPAALRVEKRESEDFAWDAMESELSEPVSECEGNVEVNGRTYLKQGRSPLYFGQTDRIATKCVNKLEFRV